VLADEAGREKWTEARSIQGFESRNPPQSVPLPPAGEGGWVILFTSGTTGTPKAVRLSVQNLEASAAVSGKNLGTDSNQRWLCTLPLVHIGALAMAARCARYGASLVLHRRFDAAAVRQALGTLGITHTSFVPQTLTAVLDVEEGPLRHTLGAVLLGGAPASPTLLARARAAAVPVLCTYGLTEASSQVCTERLGEQTGDTCGPPLPGVEVRLLGPSGHEVAPGHEGEIWVRGPTVMEGYEGLVDGWFRTGDVGVWDGTGRLRVLARREDLILSGGENVYPAELEAVLAAHPEVQEAAVVGARDARWGEVPVAFYVARRASLASASLQAFARERLAGFKVPKRFERVDVLPRNSMGKVDRAALRAQLGAKSNEALANVAPG
jgi:O-succinylbenzoic acid--CoA ligase